MKSSGSASPNNRLTADPLALAKNRELNPGAPYAHYTSRFSSQ